MGSFLRLASSGKSQVEGVVAVGASPNPVALAPLVSKSGALNQG